MDCHEGLPEVHSSSRGGHNASIFVGEGLYRQWNVPSGKGKKLAQFLLQLGFHLAFLLSKNKEIHQTDRDNIHLSTLHVLEILYFWQLPLIIAALVIPTCPAAHCSHEIEPQPHPRWCQRPRLRHITACDPPDSTKSLRLIVLLLSAL